MLLTLKDLKTVPTWFIYLHEYGYLDDATSEDIELYEQFIETVKSDFLAEFEVKVVYVLISKHSDEYTGKYQDVLHLVTDVKVTLDIR